MIRGEVGSRPLIVNINKRVVNYTKDIENRPTSTVNKALNFEKTMQVPQISLHISLISI